MSRRHRSKTVTEIVEERAAIKRGEGIPDDWEPNRNSPKYQARLRAWARTCPKCGAPSRSSCRGAREGKVRWSFHRERWGAADIQNDPVIQ